MAWGGGCERGDGEGADEREGEGGGGVRRMNSTIAEG